MSTESTLAHPEIVTRDEWLAARKQLLAREKELTRQGDRVSAERRRLPMVKLQKEYAFDGPEGEQSLGELFDGRRQLIGYHFMFDPKWEKGCPGCTGYPWCLLPRRRRHLPHLLGLRPRHRRAHRRL